MMNFRFSLAIALGAACAPTTTTAPLTARATTAQPTGNKIYLSSLQRTSVVLPDDLKPRPPGPSPTGVRNEDNFEGATLKMSFSPAKPNAGDHVSSSQLSDYADHLADGTRILKKESMVDGWVLAGESPNVDLDGKRYLDTWLIAYRASVGGQCSADNIPAGQLDRVIAICNTLHKATEAEAEADRLVIETAEKQAREREARNAVQP